MINTKFMQHLMMALAIILLAGIAGKKYHMATNTGNTMLMQMEKMRESKTGIIEDVQDDDDEFFMYGAPALYDTFL